MPVRIGFDDDHQGGSSGQNTTKRVDIMTGGDGVDFDPGQHEVIS
jgi:hypothetical protein